jgi:hypothetical protein
LGDQLELTEHKARVGTGTMSVPLTKLRLFTTLVAEDYHLVGPLWVAAFVTSFFL